MKTAISPTREEDYSEWYQQVLKAADLAEHSPVRGCMVIKPWGYGLWENMQAVLDEKLKETGHQNAYFPLFIPLSFLEREAAHVDGFAKECAVVTHHRLEKNKEGKLVPQGELEEPLVVRPTSETMIGEMFASWIQSYRDLPLLINQWANVVRWEMRTRLFLRTTEFLWQEGHTAHATSEEAEAETMQMLGVYEWFAKEFLALPVIPGEKTPSERFPGAVSTYTIEAMTQDRKALQCGTSHFLGQNFSKASQIRFRDKEGLEQFAWTTSWGVTTRLIGAMVMAHSDDDGVILPPKIATSQVVIIPILREESEKGAILEYCHQLAKELKETLYAKRPIRVVVDERDLRGGEKVWSWIKKGVPIRIEVGPRDIAKGALSIMRRDKPHKEGQEVSRNSICSMVVRSLEEYHNALLKRAEHFREKNTKKIDTEKEFYEFFTPTNRQKPEIHGGFALAHWSGDPEIEEKIRKDLGVTIRCIPFGEKEEGICPFTGKKSVQRVIYAKSY